jgi:hypothetical protein
MAKPGLYSNIRNKRARIAAGSGEKMKKTGAKGAPTNKQFEQAAKTAKKPVNLKYGGVIKKKRMKK